MTSKKPYGKILYKKPAYHGYQNMVSIVDKNVTTGPCLEVKAECSKNLYCVSMQKNGGVNGAILWFGGANPTLALTKDETDVEIWGLNLKNPVYADLLSGKVYAIKKFKKTSKGMKFKKLPLWDSPIAILESDSFLWDECVPVEDTTRKSVSIISISSDNINVK